MKSDPDPDARTCQQEHTCRDRHECDNSCESVHFANQCRLVTSHDLFFGFIQINLFALPCVQGIPVNEKNHQNRAGRATSHQQVSQHACYTIHDFLLTTSDLSLAL